jgi:hypothetical protein
VTGDHKKSYLKVEYLGEFESMYETALILGSVAQIEFDANKPEVENLLTGPLYWRTPTREARKELTLWMTECFFVHSTFLTISFSYSAQYQ